MTDIKDIKKIFREIRERFSKAFHASQEHTTSTNFTFGTFLDAHKIPDGPRRIETDLMYIECLEKQCPKCLREKHRREEEKSDER